MGSHSESDATPAWGGHWRSQILYHTHLYKFDHIVSEKNRLMFRANFRYHDIIDTDFFGFDNPSLIEFWSWHLVPGEWHDGLAHPAGTREILFVKAGELSLTIAGAVSRAKAGQTITFVADKPHRYANDGTKDVQMLMVVCEPGRTGQARS